MPDPQIFVDADACPVKEEARKVAERLGLVVTFVSIAKLSQIQVIVSDGPVDHPALVAARGAGVDVICVAAQDDSHAEASAR